MATGDSKSCACIENSANHFKTFPHLTHLEVSESGCATSCCLLLIVIHCDILEQPRFILVEQPELEELLYSMEQRAPKESSSQLNIHSETLLSEWHIKQRKTTAKTRTDDAAWDFPHCKVKMR